MPRETSEDYDQHYYADRRRRDRDNCYGKYSTSHQTTYSRERYYKDSSSDRVMQKYSRARSRSRSTSRSRHSKKSSKRSRSRSRSRYDYYSDRRRSKSRSYSDRKRSRSRSHSRHSKRSRSRNSSKHKHRRRSTERNIKRSNTPSKHILESSNLKDQNIKDYRNLEPDIQRYTEIYSTENTMNSDENKDYTYNYDNDDDNLDLEPFDKEKIHREIEEKLRETLAKEGKVYPPRKTEASHPIFANDGSFLEVFKKMQEQVNNNNQKPEKGEKTRTTTTLPAVSKRRGGRILKTGVVAKPTARNPDNSDPKDFWSLYLEEVKKYKNATCDIDGKTRPLVK